MAHPFNRTDKHFYYLYNASENCIMSDILQKDFNEIGQKCKIGFKALPRWLQVVDRVKIDMFSLF